MMKSGERMNYNLEIPCDVQHILDVLYENGYEGYMVGGCVRDLILNKKPNDYDITTNAEPDVVASLFDKVIATGLKHGTVTVVINKEQYEVTTYRRDGEYEDNRRPKNVEFVNDLKEDLSRRDFTINAMAYNNKEGLVDYYGGISDLNNKIIRTVGNPEKRFREDALRMMRAIRFAVQLDFKIDESVLKYIGVLNDNIEKISKERIREEFNKIILKNPKGVYLLNQCNLLKYISSDFDRICGNHVDNCDNTYDLFKHLIISSCHIEEKLYLRLTMLFHDIGEAYIDEKACNDYYHCLKSAEMSEKILRNLKYDNATIKKVKTLILYHHNILSDKFSIKKLLNCIGRDLFEDLIKVKRADIYAMNYEDKKQKIVEINEVEKKYHEIILENECFSIKDLNIDGKDLINAGVKKGKDIGEMLNYLLIKVMGKNDLNSKEKLLAMAAEKLNKNN